MGQVGGQRLFEQPLGVVVGCEQRASVEQPNLQPWAAHARCERFQFSHKRASGLDMAAVQRCLGIVADAPQALEVVIAGVVPVEQAPQLLVGDVVPAGGKGGDTSGEPDAGEHRRGVAG